MKSSKMTGAKIGIMVAKAASKNINSNNIRILKWDIINIKIWKIF